MTMKFMNKKERENFFREHNKNVSEALYTKPLRVKIYARVSTKHESQLNALENQLAWYKLRIKENWIIDLDKDMYIDQGITGTLAKKRDAFLKMIDDAKSPECDFDIIITREVPRFARNVEETFQYTRELRDYGIGVYFIAEDIWSFDDSPEGIMRLSMMASMAQGESKKTSDRAKWGQEISRKNGQPYGNGNILGYDKIHHNKKDIDPETNQPYKTTFTYVINEEQARTVRRIYNLCVEGLGAKRIAKVLTKEGHLTATGKSKWQESNINRILNNPTYMGYNAYGKSKVVDYLSHKKDYETDLNKLQMVKGEWEPIISEALWYKAQECRNNRKVTIINADGSKMKYGQPSEMNMWLRKLQCSCGRGFRRSKWRKNELTGEEIYGYQCWNQVNNGKRENLIKQGLPYEDACDVSYVQESSLDLMAKKVLQLVLGEQREATKRAIEMIADCSKSAIVDNSDKIASYKRKIADEEASQLKAVELTTKGLITESMLTQTINNSTVKIETYNKIIEELTNNKDSDFDKGKMMKDIEAAFNTIIDFSKPIIDYDIIDRFVNKVIVRENSEFVWILNFNKIVNLKPIERINHLSDEYKETLVVDSNFNIFADFEIGLDEIEVYHKSRGRRINKKSWKPLKVKVAIDLNN